MTEYNFGVEEDTKTEANESWDDFRNALEKEPDVKESITLSVKSRPGFKVEYRLSDLRIDKIDRWRKIARKGRKGDSVDARMFNQLILVTQCERILYNDKPALDKNGEAMTFSSPEFIDLMRTSDYYGSVANFYGSDPLIINTGLEILNQAGYGDDDSEDDDTNPFED